MFRQDITPDETGDICESNCWYQMLQIWTRSSANWMSWYLLQRKCHFVSVSTQFTNWRVKCKMPDLLEYWKTWIGATTAPKSVKSKAHSQFLVCSHRFCPLITMEVSRSMLGNPRLGQSSSLNPYQISAASFVVLVILHRLFWHIFIVDAKSAKFQIP